MIGYVTDTCPVTRVSDLKTPTRDYLKRSGPSTIRVTRGCLAVGRLLAFVLRSFAAALVSITVLSITATAQDAALRPNAKEFDSGLISPGKDYSHTFTVPGTYKYFCIPHEAVGMLGTVIVSK